MGEVCLGFSVVRAQGLRMGLEFRGLVQARLQGLARVYGAVYRLSGLEVVGEPPEENWLSTGFHQDYIATLRRIQ